MPTHSKHNLIALLNTVAASPRQAPKHSMAAPAISSTTCAAAFFAGAALFARFGRAVRYVGAGLLVIIAVRGVI